jgi:Raf kinase inhibitor-like YbhB/YbcL family protein
LSRPRLRHQQAAYEEGNVNRQTWYRLLVTVCLLVLAGCRGAELQDTPAVAGDSTLALSSPVFGDGGAIPAQYTCDGQDVSPPLAWSGRPSGTESFALIVDDPDAPAGTWVHWVIYDLPAETRQLPEGVPADDRLADGGVQGRNSWPKMGYGGPCPPSGTHHYFFKLYALDIMLGADPGLGKAELLAALEGHVLAQAQLVGTYARQE